MASRGGPPQRWRADACGADGTAASSSSRALCERVSAAVPCTGEEPRGVVSKPFHVRIEMSGQAPVHPVVPTDDVQVRADSGLAGRASRKGDCMIFAPPVPREARDEQTSTAA